MTERECLFVIAMEECDEISQRLSKALRFTSEEVQNGERVVQEFADLTAVLEMLQDIKALPGTTGLHWSTMKKLKRDKVERFMKYSRERGTVK